MVSFMHGTSSQTEALHKCWKSINRVILDIAQEFIVKIKLCYPLDCQTYLEKQWWNFTVQSAWMYTHQSPPNTTTQTGPTLAPGSHTCCIWCTQSIVLSGQPISLCQDYMVSKFTQWPISFNFRLPQVLRAPSKATARCQYCHRPTCLLTETNKNTVI